MTPGTGLPTLPWGGHFTILLLLVAVFIICIIAVPWGFYSEWDPVRLDAVYLYGKSSFCLKELSIWTV